ALAVGREAAIELPLVDQEAIASAALPAEAAGDDQRLALLLRQLVQPVAHGVEQEAVLDRAVLARAEAHRDEVRPRRHAGERRLARHGARARPRPPRGPRPASAPAPVARRPGRPRRTRPASSSRTPRRSPAAPFRPWARPSRRRTLRTG